MWDNMRDDPKKGGRKPRGRHPEKRLTAVSVRAIKTSGRHGDGNGLYLVVDPSGAKRWVQRIVVASKRCDIGLGSASLVGLAEAREEAHRLRGLARRGVDVLAERRFAKRTVSTFEETARKVHKQHSPTYKNDKHRAQWLASLEADVFPMIGKKRVDAIDTADILKVLSPIWTTKPETARRLKQRIKVILDWAKASGERTGANPTDGLKEVLPKDRAAAKHHPALFYNGVSAFLHDLRTTEAVVSAKLAFEFLILTATRTSEVLQMTWEEVDLVGRTWTIPATRMKASREHRVPLARRAVKILEEARALADGGSYVFPGRPKEPLSNMVFLMLLRRMKRDEITAHGFRSSFRDWAAERTNAPRAVCEAALAHALRDKTEAAYNRTDLFERRRKLMEAWAVFATAKSTQAVAAGA